MTIQFHENIKKPYLCKFIATGFSAAWNYGNSISVYAGIQPTAKQITDNWSNYNTSSPDFLAHFTEGKFAVEPSHMLLKLNSGFSATGGSWSPSNCSNVGTGEASWAILWDRTITKANVDGILLPNTAFIVVNVSDVNGDGVIRFQDINFNSGVFNPIFDGTFGATVF